MEDSDFVKLEEKKQPSWVGYVDDITESLVHGWICDRNNLDLSVEVEIYADGVKIGEILADRHRPDLRDAGFGNGDRGFNFSFPVSIEGQKITVKVKNSDYKVPKSAALLEKEAPLQESPLPVEETPVELKAEKENSLGRGDRNQEQAVEKFLFNKKDDYQFSNEAFSMLINVNPYRVSDRDFVEMAQPLSNEDFIRATFLVYMEREPTVEEKDMWHSDIKMRNHRYALPRTLRMTSTFLTRKDPKNKDNILKKIFKTIFKFLRRLVTLNRFVEIIDVVNSCLSDQENFWGGWIDFPQTNQKYWGQEVAVAGWVLGKKYRVTSVKLSIGKTILQEVPVNGYRPDVVESYVLQQNGSIEFCGYGATLNPKDFPREGVLRLEAVFSNNNILPVGIIRFQK